MTPFSFEAQEENLKRLLDQQGIPFKRSKTGLDLRGVSLAKADLSGLDLSGADLTEADLTGARLFKTTLKGALLSRAILREAELTGADLTGAFLEETDLSYAGLGMATLKQAQCFRAQFKGSTLTKADLREVDFRGAFLHDVRMREADLSGADFTSVELQGADMSLCHVEGATFTNANLQDTRLRAIKGYEQADWIGVDIRDINFAGAYRMRRFIVDQNYLKEFREQSRLTGFLYFIWWATSDCGRSPLRWCFWIAMCALLYAVVFAFVEVDYGAYETWLSPFYYSVVTMTTLGYGDVLPASTGGQIVAMLEVITGYVLLGGLLSIFSNKVARRAE